MSWLWTILILVPAATLALNVAKKAHVPVRTQFGSPSQRRPEETPSKMLRQCCQDWKVPDSKPGFWKKFVLIGHHTWDVVVTVWVTVEAGCVTIETLTETAVGQVEGFVGTSLWLDAVDGMVTNAVSVTVEGVGQVLLLAEHSMADDPDGVVVNGPRVMAECTELDVVEGAEIVDSVTVGGLKIAVML